MAGIPTLLEQLTEREPGWRLILNEITTRNDYETIRTALVKKWNEHKQVLIAIVGEEDSSLQFSLCGDYNEKEQTATFYLGKSRKRVARSYSFSILPPAIGGSTSVMTDDISPAKEA